MSDEIDKTSISTRDSESGNTQSNRVTGNIVDRPNQTKDNWNISYAKGAIVGAVMLATGSAGAMFNEDFEVKDIAFFSHKVLAGNFSRQDCDVLFKTDPVQYQTRLFKGSNPSSYALISEDIKNIISDVRALLNGKQNNLSKKQKDHINKYLFYLEDTKQFPDKHDLAHKYILSDFIKKMCY